MQIKTIIISTILILSLALAGCAAATPAPTATAFATAVLPTESPVPPSATPLPSTATQVPTEAPTATATPLPTLTATITNTATPAVDFAKFKLTAVTQKPRTAMSLIFTIPGLQSAVQVKVGGSSFYCQVDPKYPNKLFCNGPDLVIDTELPVRFIDTDGTTVLYKGVIYIPQSILGPKLPDNIDWGLCPQRNTNVTCETENRLWWNPPCVVSTCYDACGYFYSIDTCTSQKSVPKKK
jgi:hypothetical protein